MPLPSNIDELLELIAQEIIDNNSGLIEESTLRYVLNQLVKILDTKISLISPSLTAEQLAIWKNIADFKASDSIGVITTSTVFPDAKCWGFAEPGTYPNAGNETISANNIGVITYNGIDTFSKVELPLPQATQFIPDFSGSIFPIVGPAQRTHEGSIWEIAEGFSATSTDIPGNSSKWSEKVSSNNDSTFNCRITIEGQSNAIGVGLASGLNSDPYSKLFINWADEFSRVFIWNPKTDNYENLKIGFNNMASWDINYLDPSSTPTVSSFGSEVGIALVWLQTHRHGSLYIDKNVGDGKPISYFQKGGAYYTEKLSRKAKADQWLKDREITVMESGFLWVQGEGDMTQSKAYYKSQLETLINDRIVDGFIDQKEKLIITQISSTSANYGIGVANAKSEYVSENKMCELVSYTNDFNQDNIHLNTTGQINLGLASGEICFNTDSFGIEKITIGKVEKYDLTLDVLDYFVSGTGTTLYIDTATLTFEPKLYKIGTGYIANSFNSSVRIDVSNYDKLNISCKKWLINDSQDLVLYGTVVGVKTNGVANILLPATLSGGGITNPNQVPLETYSNINISEYQYIYIVCSNALTTAPTLTLIEGNMPSTDGVKDYIDLKIDEVKELIVSPRVFNVKDYGAKGDGVTVDRVAIQSAINTCFAAGGGKVYFPYPSEFYNLGSELTPYNQVYGQTNSSGMPSAQLIIPLNTDTTKLIMIEFVGEFKINMADEVITNVGKTQTGFIKSEHIETGTTNYSSILSSVYAGSNTWGNKNYIHVHIENLTFRNETKLGNTHIENKMIGINMGNVTQFTHDYLKIETSSPLADAIEPTFSIGIILPTVNNKAQLGEGSSYVVGYCHGVMLGEHFTSNRILIIGCVNGLLFPDSTDSFHSISIQHLNIECCRNNILMQNSNQVLNIFNYDTEHYADPTKWYNFQNDIKKTGGSGVVNIFNSQVTKSFVGNVNQFITSGSPTYKILTGVGAN